MFVKPCVRIPGWPAGEVRELEQDAAVRLLMLGNVVAVAAPHPETEAAVIEDAPARRRGRPLRKG